MVSFRYPRYPQGTREEKKPITERLTRAATQKGHVAALVRYPLIGLEVIPLTRAATQLEKVGFSKSFKFFQVSRSVLKGRSLATSSLTRPLRDLVRSLYSQNTGQIKLFIF